MLDTKSARLSKAIDEFKKVLLKENIDIQSLKLVLVFGLSKVYFTYRNKKYDECEC